MADLPKEYEAIRKQTIERAMSSNHPVVAGNMIDAVREAVERCYALHNQPPKELTDAEIDKLWAEVAPEPSHKKVLKKFADAILAAHIAKQREPEVVTFRAARRIDDGMVDMFTDLPAGDLWEWLDHDGNPQTFKVVLS